MNKIILNHKPADNQEERNYQKNILRKKIWTFSLFAILIIVVSLIIFCAPFYYENQNHVNKEMLNENSHEENYDDINVLLNTEIPIVANVKKRILTDTQINTWTANDQTNPKSSSLSDGNFVIVWQSYLQNGIGWDIHGQIFYSNGAKKGSEFLVSNYSTMNQ